MEAFDTLDEAKAFVRDRVDRPIVAGAETLANGAIFNQFVIDKDDGQFVNVYDLIFDGNDFSPEIISFDTLTGVHQFLSDTSEQYSLATGGGFFYLADRGSAKPKQLALNLSICQGSLRSLPVSDRETVIAGRNGLETRILYAMGILSINGEELDYSGSLTDYDTTAKIYSNGNAVIHHVDDEATGTHRVLDEESRYTPPIRENGLMDVGFIGRGGNNFIGVSGSKEGGVDIFAHDFIVRCEERYFQGNSELTINTIGGMALDRFVGGAFSAGPNINAADFSSHPVNSDPSLGDRPPFMDVTMARTVLYKDEVGKTHIRLFDGRPGSNIFPGVSPSEAVSQILSESAIQWGCFLDPGQTAKICVKSDSGVNSYGNAHYLHWPTEKNPKYVWAPHNGRFIASLIAL